MSSPQNTNGCLQPQNSGFKTRMLGLFGQFQELVQILVNEAQGRFGGGQPGNYIVVCDIFNRPIAAGAVLQTGAPLIEFTINITPETLKPSYANTVFARKLNILENVSPINTY